MIRVAPSIYSLADAFEYIEEQKFPLARTITQHQLDEIISVNPRFNEPTHQAVWVKYRAATDSSRVLLYSNLGYPFFNHNDILETYLLDQKEYFFDYTLQDKTHSRTYAPHEVELSTNSQLKWTAQFDYEVIFEHFGLDGHGDFAPFVGVFNII